MFLKRKFLSLFILPMVVSVTNQSSANVETTVRNEVSGESASIQTEITNKVNETETKITSTKAGEIKVSVKDGKTETNITVSPSPIISSSTSPFFSPREGIQKEIQKFHEQLRDLINSFLKRIFGFLNFRA